MRRKNSLPDVSIYNSALLVTPNTSYPVFLSPPQSPNYTHVLSILLWSQNTPDTFLHPLTPSRLNSPLHLSCTLSVALDGWLQVFKHILYSLQLLLPSSPQFAHIYSVFWISFLCFHLLQTRWTLTVALDGCHSHTMMQLGVSCLTEILL